MYVKVLFDKKAKRGLHSGHGFSCLVDNNILFDTGEGPASLIENMDRMMVSIPELKAVVISHDHWDHTGGLWEILRNNNGLKVYACESISKTFKDCVKELGGDLILVDGPMTIKKNVYTSGPIEFVYNDTKLHEQVLVVKGEKGISIITGCAHPGILPIIQHVHERFKTSKIYMVFGGIHLVETEREEISEIITAFKKLGVLKAGPSHCSGEKARRMFVGQYHENFIPVKAGQVIQL